MLSYSSSPISLVPPSAAKDSNLSADSIPPSSTCLFLVRARASLPYRNLTSPFLLDRIAGMSYSSSPALTEKVTGSVSPMGPKDIWALVSFMSIPRANLFGSAFLLSKGDLSLMNSACLCAPPAAA